MSHVSIQHTRTGKLIIYCYPGITGRPTIYITMSTNDDAMAAAIQQVPPETLKRFFEACILKQEQQDDDDYEPSFINDDDELTEDETEDDLYTGMSKDDIIDSLRLAVSNLSSMKVESRKNKRQCKVLEESVAKLTKENAELQGKCAWLKKQLAAAAAPTLALTEAPEEGGEEVKAKKRKKNTRSSMSAAAASSEVQVCQVVEQPEDPAPAPQSSCKVVVTLT